MVKLLSDGRVSYRDALGLWHIGEYEDILPVVQSDTEVVQHPSRPLYRWQWDRLEQAL